MRALAQGVGSRRPLLLYPRGVPPARGCAVARLRPHVVAGGVVVGLMGEWWLGFAVVAGGVVSGGMSLVSLWLVFVGGLGGIATIGAALRRVVGVSGVYGRKTPRVVARNGQGRVPVEGSMVAKPPVVAWKGQRRVVFRWLCWSCSTSLSSCPGGVACFRWWLGGNCYHRRCVAACRRRVGGLWSQNPPSACSKCSPPRWYAGDMGCLGCSGRRFGRAGSWRVVFCGAACWARPSLVRAAGMIEPPVGA